MILFQELLFLTGIIRLLHLQEGGIIDAEVCDRLGGKGTFNSISRAQSNGFRCMNEFYNTEPEATWCSTCQHRQTCFYPKLVASKRCLNSTQLVDFEILGKIDADLVTYVCNNQEIIANYEEDLTKQCISVLDKTQLRCLNLRSEDASDMDFLEFIHKKIGPIKIDEAEICIRDTLSEHCSDGVSDIMVSILKILQNNASLVKTKTLIRSKRSLRRVVRQLAMNDKFGKLEGHAKNLCIKNGHLSQKLEDTLEKMKTCLREKPVFSIPKHEYIAHVDACTKEAIALFKSCLPEKYKYIPQLLFDIYDAMIGFLYDDFILIGTVLNECLPKLRSEESHKKYEACIEKVEDGSDEELVDSKEKFCKKFEALNECFLTEVKTECKASADLTKFEKDFKEAFTRPCKTTK